MVQSLRKCECVTPVVLTIKRIILFGHLCTSPKHQPLCSVIVHVVCIHSQEGAILPLSKLLSFLNSSFSEILEI